MAAIAAREFADGHFYFTGLDAASRLALSGEPPRTICTLTPPVIIELVTPEDLRRELRQTRQHHSDSAGHQPRSVARILVSEVATQVPPEDFPSLSLYGWIGLNLGAAALRKCLDTVADGHLWVPRLFLERNFPYHPARTEDEVEAVAETAESPSMDNLLSEREVTALHLMRRGLSNKEIALSLGVTIHTAKKHVHNVMRKMGIRKRRQIVDMHAA